MLGDTSEPAVTMAPVPMTEPSRTVEPAPTNTLSSSRHAWITLPNSVRRVGEGARSGRQERAERGECVRE